MTPNEKMARANAVLEWLEQRLTVHREAGDGFEVGYTLGEALSALRNMPPSTPADLDFEVKESPEDDLRRRWPELSERIEKQASQVVTLSCELREARQQIREQQSFLVAAREGAESLGKKLHLRELSVSAQAKTISAQQAELGVERDRIRSLRQALAEIRACTDSSRPQALADRALGSDERAAKGLGLPAPEPQAQARVAEDPTVYERLVEEKRSCPELARQLERQVRMRRDTASRLGETSTGLRDAKLRIEAVERERDAYRGGADILREQAKERRRKLDEAELTIERLSARIGAAQGRIDHLRMALGKIRDGGFQIEGRPACEMTAIAANALMRDGKSDA